MAWKDDLNLEAKLKELRAIGATVHEISVVIEREFPNYPSSHRNIERYQLGYYYYYIICLADQGPKNLGDLSN